MDGLSGKDQMRYYLMNFQLFSVVFLLVIMCTGIKSAQQNRQRRSFIDFANMVNCATGRDPLDYLGYGCHCGLGGKGKILDAIDRCCYKHDECYSQLRKKGLCSAFALYFYSYDHSCYKCDSTNRGCAKELCRCDRKAARCFKRHKYDKRMKNIAKREVC